MREIVGKTVKIGTNTSIPIVGVFASVDKGSRTGIFVGYISNLDLKEVKMFRVNFNGKPYETENQFNQDLRSGKFNVNVKELKASKMPRGVGKEVKTKVKNIQNRLNKKEGELVIDLTKQKDYKKDIKGKFEVVIENDPDLGSDAYFEGLTFLDNKGFYYIKKSEIDAEKREELERLTRDAIESLATFMQDAFGGSTADYYCSALNNALKDYTLYVNTRKVENMGKVRRRIVESASYPDRSFKEISDVFHRYRDLKVKK